MEGSESSIMAEELLMEDGFSPSGSEVIELWTKKSNYS
jgi:hypothetical protein